MEIDGKYFKEYRERLGFTNQDLFKDFFAAKDLIPNIDYVYLLSLNQRLCDIVQKIDRLVDSNIKIDSLEIFCRDYIDNYFKIIKENGIILKLNNNGRRSEEVYFSWMRGQVICSYFLRALSQIFVVDLSGIKIIGEDDLYKIETFRRSRTADLQIELNNKTQIRIEIQSGFQGVNDIKLHKVIEAKKIKSENGIPTIIIHFDVFNGQVAFLRADEIKDDNINWITRQQMEGQTVFNIDQNYFVWKLTEKPPLYTNLFLL